MNPRTTTFLLQLATIAVAAVAVTHAYGGTVGAESIVMIAGLAVLAAAVELVLDLAGPLAFGKTHELSGRTKRRIVLGVTVVLAGFTVASAFAGARSGALLNHTVGVPVASRCRDIQAAERLLGPDNSTWVRFNCDEMTLNEIVAARPYIVLSPGETRDALRQLLADPHGPPWWAGVADMPGATCYRWTAPPAGSAEVAAWIWASEPDASGHRQVFMVRMAS